MTEYPFNETPVDWKRPPSDKAVLRDCLRKSDLQGWLHCLGVLAILGATGTFAYLMFLQGRWVLLAVALYLHGAAFAFNPQTHELSHGTVFRTKSLNGLFKRLFGIIHWNSSNAAAYRISHVRHHRYTTFRGRDGEVVLPMPRTKEDLLFAAVLVVNPTGLIATVYDKLYGLLTPYLRNPRRGAWQRYVYAKATPGERRDVYLTELTQVLFHVAFGVAAVLSGHWFLIVVVTLPGFYGGRWYHLLVHDTMHSGREPDSDDFRKCCRSVRVDPLTSLLYWHMEWHAEHHAFPGIPCYRLKEFHRRTAEHWDKPQSLIEAWREMDRRAREDLALKPAS